jgi:hypothetical protein
MAKGLENLIITISGQLATIEKAVDDVYYGNPLNKSAGIKLPGSNSKVNGVLPLVREISSYDLCNIIATVLSFAPNPQSVVQKQLDKVKDQSKKLLNKLGSSTLGKSFVQNTDNLKNLATGIEAISNSISPDLVSISPSLASTQNFLNDLSGTLRNGTSSPTSLLSKINQLQTSLHTLNNLNTPLDVLSLAQQATGVNIAAQIQNLQKTINPAQILPTLQSISILLGSINQMGLKLLKYVNLIQTIITLSQSVLTTINVIVKVIKLISVPNMYTASSFNQALGDSLNDTKTDILKPQQKVLAELQVLLDLIYTTVISFTGKISQLQAAIAPLIFNLQTCVATADSPELADLDAANNSLTDVSNKLNDFAKYYAAAQSDPNQKTFHGYVLKIQEEQTIDHPLQFKRRHAVALDPRGVQVAQTELTYSTDNQVIFQELQLIIGNSHYPSTSTETEASIYNSIGVDPATLDPTSQKVSTAAKGFINSLPGGKSFIKDVAAATASDRTPDAIALKASAQAGDYKPTAQTQLPIQPSEPTISVGGPAPSGVLSPESQAKWESIATNPNTPLILRQRAQTILNQSRAAQGDQQISGIK